MRAEVLGERRQHLPHRRHRGGRRRAVRGPAGEVDRQALVERAAAEPPQLVQHQGGADPDRAPTRGGPGGSSDEHPPLGRGAAASGRPTPSTRRSWRARPARRPGRRGSRRRSDRCRPTGRRPPSRAGRAARTGGRSGHRPVGPGRPCGSRASTRRSSARSARRRSTSVPPSSPATRSVSHTASQVGSASWARSTDEGPLEVGGEQPLARAAAKAGRSSSGPASPTSSSAWGIDRPTDPVRTRSSSIMRGHAVLCGGQPGLAPLPVGGHRQRGREEPADERGEGAAEQRQRRLPSRARTRGRPRRGTPRWPRCPGRPAPATPGPGGRRRRAGGRGPAGCRSRSRSAGATAV